TPSPNLTTMISSFGDIPAFRNVTKFGDTFKRAVPGNLIESGIVLPCANQALDLSNAVIDMDKSAYTFNKAATNHPVNRTSLFCACSVDKDRVIRIESPILEAKPSTEELITKLIAAASSNSPVAIFEQQIASIDREIEQLSQQSIQAVIDGDVDEVIRIARQVEELRSKKVEIERRRDEAVRDVSGVPGNEAVPDVGGRPGLGFPVRGNATDADGNSQNSAAKIVENIKRIFGPGSFEMHSKCYQPAFVYVPTRSRYLRYGPVFPSSLGPNTQGRLEIIQDDGYAPWEFGGFALMLEAMQLKVDSAISQVREV